MSIIGYAIVKSTALGYLKEYIRSVVFLSLIIKLSWFMQLECDRTILHRAMYVSTTWQNTQYNFLHRIEDI